MQTLFHVKENSIDLSKKTDDVEVSNTNNQNVQNHDTSKESGIVDNFDEPSSSKNKKTI